MPKPSSRIVVVIACAGLAWQPSSALAGENDVQFWFYTIAAGELDHDTRLAVDFSARWREQQRGDEQQTLRFTIEQEAAQGVRIGGGFGIFEAGGQTELRPHQQLTLVQGRFSARTRLEQRFFDQSERMELRFRQRVRYTQPLSRRVSASIDGEYLNLLQTRNRGPDQARDQWRGRFILQYRLGERMSLGAAYLFIHTPRPIGQNLNNHVPQGLLTYRF